MHRLKRTGITLLVLVGMLAGSAVAVADDAEEVDRSQLERVADTLFSFGYDLIFKVFLWNISDPGDTESGCTVEGEGVTYTAGETEGSFTTADGCELTGGDVTGREGQVNHGMFLKLFNEMFDGPGWERGCLVREIARSDLGKGGQQVKAGEEAEPVEPSEGDPTADFTSIETRCEPGPPGEVDLGVEVESNGNGRPEWAPGPPPWAGKPGGRNGAGGDE